VDDVRTATHYRDAAMRLLDDADVLLRMVPAPPEGAERAWVGAHANQVAAQKVAGALRAAHGEALALSADWGGENETLNLAAAEVFRAYGAAALAAAELADTYADAATDYGGPALVCASSVLTGLSALLYRAHEYAVKAQG
jgi:hypothetical protein